MLVNDPNPYQPPGVLDSGLPTNFGSGVMRLLVPPLLTIVITLLLWVGLALLLGRMANNRNVIFLWSLTLIISTASSIYFVCRLWRQKVSATSVGIGYFLFGIAFCLLEGDTSRGTDLVQASTVYGTLIALPLIAFLLTWNLNRSKARK